MLSMPDFITARSLLADTVSAVGTERLPLSRCAGRILAEDVTAAENVPPFDRSPYDGYALRSCDVSGASRDNSVTLAVVEEVPAGAVPTEVCGENMAVKILTGAPIPEGADCVVKYECTEFTESSVRIFAPMKSGENIVRTGEDVKKGQLLAAKGSVIDAGVAGTLSSQGIAYPLVYRQPKVAVISTGNEVVETGCELPAGKIYNSNRYTLTAALERAGCRCIYLGLAGDRTEDIAEMIQRGVEECDAVISTGGVSVGDYDCTPDAMEKSGVNILIRGVDMKPGMACAYGEKGGKLVCGLSGNPASALTSFHAVAAPALRKLTGRSGYMPEMIKLRLKNGFGRKSPMLRLLRGKLELSDGTVGMILPEEQGNAVISSAIGTNIMAIVPAGSGALEAGTILEGFLI